MRLLRRDEGFSLTELMVVVALLGLVMAGAWSLLRVVTISTEQNSEVSWMSNEIGQPMENAERMFSQQAPPLQQVGPYVCQIRTDQDRDNLYEMHIFEATDDGRLIEVFWEELGSSGTTATPTTRLWSVANTNKASGIPLFRYYDVNGLNISGQSVTNIKQSTASIEITIVADQDERRFIDSRRIFFRNR